MCKWWMAEKQVLNKSRVDTVRFANVSLFNGRKNKLMMILFAFLVIVFWV